LVLPKKLNRKLYKPFTALKSNVKKERKMQNKPHEKEFEKEGDIDEADDSEDRIGEEDLDDDFG